MREKLFFIILALASSFSIAAADDFLDIKEMESLTQDKAVVQFVNGLKNGNLEQMFYACAINETAGLFDYRKFCARLLASNPYLWKAPNVNQLYIDINKIDSMNSLARQIKMLSYSLLTSDPDNLATTTPINDEAINAFITENDISRLKTVEYVRSDFSQRNLETNERYLQTAKGQAIPFGAEDSSERLVLIRFEGNYLYFGIHLLKYGDAWKIDSLNAPLAGIDNSGKAISTTRGEYLKKINGES